MPLIDKTEKKEKAGKAEPMPWSKALITLFHRIERN